MVVKNEAILQMSFNSLQSIECFHSRGQHLCKFIGTKESICIRRVQLPQDWFGTPTWQPFHCFGTPTWPPSVVFSLQFVYVIHHHNDCLMGMYRYFVHQRLGWLLFGFDLLHFIRGTQWKYSSKLLKHSIVNVFQYLNGRYRHIFIP